MRQKIRIYFAEFIGTFFLVLFGTGAIIIGQEYPGSITNLGISLVFGLSVGLLIFWLSPFSGAHINPAVTIALLLNRQITLVSVVLYTLFQLSGALLASFILKGIFPSNLSLGSTIPSGSAAESFWLEMALTFILMFTILLVSANSYRSRFLVPVSVGTVIFLEAWIGGPISGASMNPARSLAPALISGQTHYLWVYLISTISGASLAVIFWKIFQRYRQLR